MLNRQANTFLPTQPKFWYQPLVCVVLFPHPTALVQRATYCRLVVHFTVQGISQCNALSPLQTDLPHRSLHVQFIQYYFYIGLIMELPRGHSPTQAELHTLLHVQFYSV